MKNTQTISLLSVKCLGKLRDGMKLCKSVWVAFFRWVAGFAGPFGWHDSTAG